MRQTGASYAHPYFVLCVLPNGLDISRAGFVTSRRIGKAVVRNRARRRLSETIRLMWDLIEPGWDIVWIARPAINEADFASLQQASVRLLRRVKVLRTDQGTPERRSSAQDPSPLKADALPVRSNFEMDQQL